MKNLFLLLVVGAVITGVTGCATPEQGDPNATKAPAAGEAPKTDAETKTPDVPK